MELRDKNGLTEQEFLAGYQPGKYPRPSFTVDAAVFSIMGSRSHSITGREIGKLKLLLIKRKGHPFLGAWALPGGFVDPNETAQQAAVRELEEETGLADQYLKQFYTFSDPSRDPRAWSISSAYYALSDHSEMKVEGADDASEARWFDVGLSCVKKENDEKRNIRIRHYLLNLASGEEKLKARIEIRKHILQNKIETEVKIIENQGLAFDHGKIITYGILKMRNSLLYTDTIFGVLPEQFTLKQLQKVYEILTEQKLIKPEEFFDSVGHLIEKIGTLNEKTEYLYRKKDSVIWE